MRFPIGCAAAAAAIGFRDVVSGCMSRTQRGALSVPSSPSAEIVQSSVSAVAEPIEGFDPAP